MEEMMKSYMIIPVYDMVILPDVDYQLGTAAFSDEEKSLYADFLLFMCYLFIF